MHAARTGSQRKRPQDPSLDGTGLRFETLEHGGEYPDTMPQAIKVTDAEGREIAAKAKPFRQGMVFRCNMDGSDVEVLGHNFRNNYEVCIDSFGTLETTAI